MPSGGDGVSGHRAALERVSDGFVSLDADFRFTYVNPHAESVFRRSSDDLLGRVLWEAFPEITPQVITELTDSFDAQERRAFRVDSDAFHRTFTVYSYPDESGLTVMFSDAPIEAADGGRNLDGQSNHEAFGAMVEETDAAVFVKDTTGRIEYINNAGAALFDRDPADLIDARDEDLFDEEMAAEIRDIDRRVIETGASDVREATRELDGVRRVFIENTFPYRDAGGEVQGVMGISHDITELQEREQALQRRHDRLDEFASVVSHDLMNPIAIAQGRLALLESESESEHLESLGTALDRIESITADTLTLARQGAVVTDPEPFQMTDLVGACWAMIGATDATLALDDEFVIVGDPDRLQHVFENLFRNAVTHGGPSVAVHIGRLDDEGFYVEDDGPGVPAAAMDAIFEPGHGSTSGGTGFGLTIVKRIADAHGWTVDITGGRDGGARFEFRGVELRVDD